MKTKNYKRRHKNGNSRNIKKDIEELNKRAKNTIDIDKKKDYIQGIEDIKTKYKDKYTDEALAETINTYKQDKLKGIYDTLNKFDEQSKELGKNIEERILKLEEKFQGNTRTENTI
ncbi:hypothetical protein KFV55_13485 (plasmid) [Staphylococcus epidermidis]|uniref:hypothetical protein n=1 Tax=Staphylococcus epidermidis TaxID=1282 RepID=UPI001C5941CD|nr:hypothetical protein [Staphylococcus epidermidis]QXU78885.1 hypothetical protein KFV55_13485 [Staphylococcus epidermidis]